MVQRENLETNKKWIDAIQDLKIIGMTWEVGQQLSVSREGWRRRGANVSLIRDDLRYKVRSRPTIIIIITDLYSAFRSEDTESLQAALQAF